jgi:hypothetical protein
MVAALIADGFRNYLRADTENRRRNKNLGSGN